MVKSEISLCVTGLERVGPLARDSLTHPPSAMNRLSLFALAFLLPLAACETEPDTVEQTDVIIEEPVAMDPVEPMAEPMATDVTAQGTVDAVTAAGGLTSLAPGAAVSNIDGWIAQLQGNPDFAPVVTDLETLKTQLTSSPLDGSAIGATLQSLGAATTGAAGGDSALETLGSTLTSAGDQLAGSM